MNLVPQNDRLVSRRNFLRLSSMAGVACGMVCLCPFSELMGADGDVPDPKKINYCGHVCPKDCPMKKAGLSDNIEEKKKAYEMWKIKERYGLEFEPEKVFCNGCKTDKSLGVAVDNCPVRKCAVKKEVDSCIVCGDLKTCKERLWTEYPGFHKHVLSMQEKYMASLKS